MRHYESCDQWAFSVTPKKGGGWVLLLIDCGRSVDLVHLFPAGEEGQEQAVDAGLEWIWSEGRGMGLHGPMEAAEGS
jgi:hypothetical protein